MKTAIVFSGGGARGAYQVGAWKALDKLGIKADIVTGTSIGSINGALYVVGSLDEAVKLWENCNFNMVFSEDFGYNSKKDHKKVISKYIKSIKNGGMEPNNLQDNLQKCIDVDKFFESEIDYGLTTVSYPKFKIIELTKKDIVKEKLIDYIIASSTVFPVFKIKEIDNKKYIDGGFRNSIPIDIALNLNAERIIVIDISLSKIKMPFEKVPKEIVTIRPNNKIGTPLTFDSNTARKNIKYGYNDVMKKFNKFYGKKYTFRNIEKYYEKNNYFKNTNELITSLEQLGSLFHVDDSIIYNIDNFNNKLEDAINNFEFKNLDKIKKIQNLEKLINNRDKIIFIYYQLVSDNKKILNKLKVIFAKQYKAAYYLYKNININI